MKKLLLLLVFAAGAWGQTTCALQFTLTAVGNSPPFDNRGAGCTTWTVTYNSYGFSALSLVVQTAPNNAGVPGSWSTFAAVTGVNPNTATDENVSTFGGITSYFPFLRVRLASATGTGKIQGKLYANVNIFSAGGGGGSTSPGLPFNSVQYNCAGVFCGSADLIYIDAALSTPAGPVVTKQGTGTGTTWGYKLVARNAVGATVDSAQGTVSGNAVLDGTHTTTIATVTATGVTSYDVYRTTPNDGWIGNVAPGASLIDNGITALAFDLHWNNNPSNNSKGLFLNGHFRMPSFGDAADSGLYIGTYPTSFTNGIPANHTLDSQNVFAFSGTITDFNTSGLLGCVVESNNYNCINVDAFSIGNNSAGVVGVAAVVGSAASATGTHTQAAAYKANNFSYGSSVITDSIAFLSNGGGSQPTNFYGVKINSGVDGTAATYGYWTNFTAGTGKWAFYGSGTAASHFGGRIELASIAFASLGTPANTSEYYCSDCTVTSGIDNTCAGTGSGAMASRINGAWKCFL